MLFLADESCDARIVRRLRGDGHDVLDVSHSHRGADDSTVIKLALGMSRILLTEDKDFGQLVYAAGHGHSGVILLRYPFRLCPHIAEQLSALLSERAESLSRCFVVVEPGRVRILSD